ncbi:hypothetical protein [Candidatus Phaeomarinobacter ectocarpi]|nr:hypothetical protein [Candidatus Phaeomarinobacter ectocarpi]
MGRLSIRRQFGIMALAGACAFTIGGMAAFANGGPASLDTDAAVPALATSVVHITATAPAFAGEEAGFSTESDTPPFGYTYVIYFPVDGSDLTDPARDTLDVIAAEVTGLDLSHVSLATEDGPVERTQVVRDALVEMGVPARWIGEDIEDPESIGPISMAPMGS